MDQNTYRKVFTQFLYDYWGAFHEALEAQSVTPSRLAGSLFAAIRTAHHACAAMYQGPARGAVDTLGRVWIEVAADRAVHPDAPLSRATVETALAEFERIFEALRQEGDRFRKTRASILAAAPHGIPGEPLRADARA